MDLKQRKLSKSEWETIEIPVSTSETEILHLITNGYSNVNLKVNKTDSIFTHLKIEYSHQIEEYLYIKFFADKIKDIVQKYNISFIRFGSNSKRTKIIEENEIVDNHIYYMNLANIVKLKSRDQIRLSKLNTDTDFTHMYEFILFNNLEQMLELKHSNNKHWLNCYYTITKLIDNSVET